MTADLGRMRKGEVRERRESRVKAAEADILVSETIETPKEPARPPVRSSFALLRSLARLNQQSSVTKVGVAC